MLPTLYLYLSQHAPNIKISIKNIPLFGEKTLLEEKEIELAIGHIHYADKSASLSHDILFREKLVCIGKPMPAGLGGPAADDPTTKLCAGTAACRTLAEHFFISVKQHVLQFYLLSFYQKYY